MQPLDGVVVLDFSTLLPGPLAGLLLAEAGAEVIKIERPGTGDEMRQYPPMIGRDSALFAMLNRGKKSIEIDLKSQEGKDRLRPYLERADIVIEQFRPGVMDRLGLGYKALSKEYPGLIYCSITGFGQDGPAASVAGHDLNYIATTGLLSLSLGQPEQPVIPPALIADIAGGAYPAVMNILLALQAKTRHGSGAHLDISMTDNMFPLMWWALGQHAATGVVPKNGADLLTGGTARYQLYPAQDGEIIAAAPIEDRFWAKFCGAIQLDPKLRNDRIDPDATKQAVAAKIAVHPGSYWKNIFDAADCCCCLVADLGEALSDPHFVARGIFDRRTDIAGAEITALPLPIDRQFLDPETKSPPKLGAKISS